jgi:hypothetical protein
LRMGGVPSLQIRENVAAARYSRQGLTGNGPQSGHLPAVHNRAVANGWEAARALLERSVPRPRLNGPLQAPGYRKNASPAAMAVRC